MTEFKCKELVALILSMVSLLLLREFWLLSRNGIHVDESLSFMLSAYKDIGMSRIPDGVITGSKLREMMWFSDNSFSGWSSDISRLWHDNRDTPHSNLYYSLLRTWFMFGGGKSRFFTMFWAGQLNIILSAVAMLCIWRIAKGLTKSSVIALVTMVVAFISTGSISDTIFLRPYQLQETAFCAYFLMMYLYIVEKRSSLRFMAAFGLMTALTALTGYFSLILLAMTSLVLLSVYIQRSLSVGEYKFREIGLYIVVALLFLFLIYPPYLFVFGTRQSEALSKATDVLGNIKESIRSLKMLSDYYFLPLLACVTGMLVSLYFTIKYRSTNHFFILSLLSCSLVWYLVVMFFAPYKVPRYILPVIPALSISYSCLIAAVGVGRKSITIFLSLFILVASLHPYSKSTVQYQYGTLPKECRNYDGEVAFVISASYRINAIVQCLQDDRNYFFAKNLQGALSRHPAVIFSDTEIYSDIYEMTKKKEDYSYFYEYNLK